MIVEGKMNYLNDSLTYYSGEIFEYDMKHAYPSILKGTDFIFEDKNLRNDIESLNDYHNKKEMLIRIGKEFKKNKDMVKYVNDTIIETLENFQISNNLDINNVITIKKDALFVTKRCNNLKYSNIEFSLKNNYNMYFYDSIKRHEYFILKKLNKLSFDIKGIKNENIDKCVHNEIVKLITFTINNMDLSKVKYIQDIMLNNKEQAFDYIPQLIPYKELIYMDKDKLLNDGKIDFIDYRCYYYEHYYSICKILINLILG